MPTTTPAAAFIASLTGLSDDPLRRAAQIALAAIGCTRSSDSTLSMVANAGLIAAYEVLSEALAE